MPVITFLWIVLVTMTSGKYWTLSNHLSICANTITPYNICHARCVHNIYSIYLYAGEEYCRLETLNAKCPENQLIMMTEAEYGLMERNRCIQPKDDLSKDI